MFYAEGAAMNRLSSLLAVLILFPISQGTWAAEKIRREDLGRSVKLTILVDKVLQPEEKWVTKEWMVRATAEAGFNVLSPRAGYERMDEVRQVAAWCEKYGIYYMPWMRGSLAVSKGDKADGKRIVWANGTEQEVWSPNAEEFWDWTNRYILEYARISVENEHLMGVFLDYENYAKGKQGNLYPLSYDNIILQKFAAAQKTQLPALEPARRKAWLDEQGLHEKFSAFQIDYWRAKCRALRKAVDAVNPKFQFCIYPAPGTLFMVEATYPEWSTAQAPLILADANTYGRPGRLITEQDALVKNQQKLERNREIPKQAGIPFIYTGGIDPVVRGADPEFSGKNAVAISEKTDGYWIFYEGPHYREQDHADYWKWFTWANRAIAKKDFAVQHHARETPENWSLTRRATTDLAKIVAPPLPEKPVALPEARLRGENVLFLGCKAGKAVELGVKVTPVGSDRSPLVWEARDAAMANVGASQVESKQTGVIRFVPQRDGIHTVILVAGRSLYRLTTTNVPVGIFAADRLGIMGGVKSLYFHVPAGTRQFAIQASGSGGETVRVKIVDPDGKMAATGQTSPDVAKVSIPAIVGSQGGKTWSLETGRADQGTLEDYTLSLQPPLPGVVSLVPEQAFQTLP
jgi:hypothetical protein